MKKALAVFDFDGTITKKDSLLEFAKYSHGYIKFYYELFCLLPFILFNKLNLFSSQKLKERFLRRFYYGFTNDKIFSLGRKFSQEIIPQMVKRDAWQKILWHKQKGHRILILSASLDVWLQPWCHHHNFELISSTLKIEKDKISGELNGNNCKGKEKVVRLLNFLGDQSKWYIYGYGDSKADRYFYKLVDEVNHRSFIN